MQVDEVECKRISSKYLLRTIWESYSEVKVRVRRLPDKVIKHAQLKAKRKSEGNLKTQSSKCTM